MENTNWETAQDAAPQNDWQNAETAITENTDAVEAAQYDIEDGEEVTLYAAAGYTDPDPEEEEDEEDEDDEDEEEDDEEEEEEESGDWGHTDPAESNSPFPDSNEPSFPGSAI